MAAAPSFDVYQQIFSLSWMSNNLDSIGAPAQPEDTLAQMLYGSLSNNLTVHGNPPDFESKASPDPDVIAKIGSWDLVWGPAVFTPKPDKNREAANAVFVAHCPDVKAADGSEADLPSKNMYVVAIAATNMYDAYDWVKEDASVNTVVEWHAFLNTPTTAGVRIDRHKNDEKAYISHATALGCYNILELMPSPAWSGPNSGMSLGDYLKTVTGGDPMIVFTGHSLAGALSPTLALWFNTEPQTQLAGFTGGVYAYPTAGATPGNRLFHDAYKAKFPPHAFGSHTVNTKSGERHRNINARLWNHYDVVPHAWALLSHIDADDNWSPMLEQIPALYGTPVLDSVLGDVGVASAAAIASGASYHTLPGVRLDGRQPETPPDSQTKFLEYLGEEHVQAYVQPSWASSETNGLILPDKLPVYKPTARS